MGPHGPRVTADHIADSHASDVATNMKPWQQQHTRTSPTHLCAGPPIGTYSTLQNSSLSAHPATNPHLHVSDELIHADEHVSAHLQYAVNSLVGKAPLAQIVRLLLRTYSQLVFVITWQLTQLG